MFHELQKTFCSLLLSVYLISLRRCNDGFMNPNFGWPLDKQLCEHYSGPEFREHHPLQLKKLFSITLRIGAFEFRFFKLEIRSTSQTKTGKRNY